MPGHVAGAGHRHGLVAQAFVLVRQHALQEIDQPVAGGFRPQDTAAEIQAFAGERAAEGTGKFAVHAEQIAHFAHAHAHVTGGHVDVRPHVMVKLRHQRLAETHDLRVAASLGVEIGAALAGAQRQAGERVLDGLLQGQKRQHVQVHRGVEPQPAFVGAQGAVHLHPVGPVHPHLALVVHPGHAETNHPLRLQQPGQQPLGAQLGVLIQIPGHTVQQAFRGLVKMGVVGVALFDLF